MLILHTYHGIIDGDPRGVVGKVAEGLSDAFKPVLRPAMQAQFAVLGLLQDERPRPRRPRYRDVEYGSDDPATDGEIFADGKCVYVLSVRSPRRGRRAQLGLLADAPEDAADKPYLELACISPEADCTGFEAFQRAAKEHASVELVEQEYTSVRFDELKAEGRESPSAPTTEELRAADVLGDRAARTLAIAIKAAGGLLLRDLAKQLPPEHRDRTETLQQQLRDAGIVEAEIVIVCTKTQAQTARTQSRALLAELSEKGLRCSCGRPLGDERIEEALALTEMGRELVEKSRWLTLLVVEELRGVGVPLESILIDQQMGGDEIDCLANISGELVLFELKDKDFNLGNAYSFGAKIGIIRPQHSVIVSTERVGNDAKDHFQRAGLVGGARQRRFVGMERQSSDVQYIEGFQALPAGVEHLARRVYVADAFRIIGEVLPFGLLEPDLLLSMVEKESKAELSAGSAV